MGGYMIRGICIGLLFGLPAGAVGALTVQRTLNSGLKAGLLTGLGSSVADCLYACVGAFGLTLISDFLLKYQGIINFVGGCLILLMGIGMLIKRRNKPQRGPDGASGLGLFLTSFSVGITNPAAILTFLFAFSLFGITGQTGITEGIGLVCGVFMGTYLWWGALSGLTVLLKKRAKKDHSQDLNRLFGMIMTVLGVVVLARNF